MFDFSAKRVKLDPDAGEWVDGFFGHGDTAVKVRPFNHPDFMKAREEIDRAGHDEKAEGAAIAKALCDHILLDWKMLIADTEGPVAYSEKAAKDFIAEPKKGLEDQAAAVANLILQASITVMHRQAGVIEAVAKN